jgi:PAS domain S-box-containing protein
VSGYEQGPDELELQHSSEEDYGVIFELAGVGMAQVDPTSGRLLRLNPKMREITGYSEKELLGMTFSELTRPDDREEDLEGFQQVVRGEVPKYLAEKRYVRKNGSVVWVRVETTIVRDRASRSSVSAARSFSSPLPLRPSAPTAERITRLSSEAP